MHDAVELRAIAESEAIDWVTCAYRSRIPRDDHVTIVRLAILESLDQVDVFDRPAFKHSPVAPLALRVLKRLAPDLVEVVGNTLTRYREVID